MIVLATSHNRHPGPRAGVQLACGVTVEGSPAPDRVRGDEE